MTKTSYEWGMIDNCNRCGDEGTHHYKKKVDGFFIKLKLITRTYCKNCILEVLDEEGIEKTKNKLHKKKLDKIKKKATKKRDFYKK